jgi:hypothetical protein
MVSGIATARYSEPWLLWSNLRYSPMRTTVVLARKDEVHATTVPWQRRRIRQRGRFNTCFLVEDVTDAFLIDCDASSLIAMRKYGIDPNQVDTVFISHLHGDHFGGLPFLILDAQFSSRRTRPLTLVGPPGLRDRLAQLMELFFPGSSSVERRFTTEIHEIDAAETAVINGVKVTGYLVEHGFKRPRLHTQIAQRRCCAANHLICFQEPDLITGQWRVGEQLKYHRLYVGQWKWDRRQHALPVQHRYQEFQEKLEAVNLGTPKFVSFASRFGALDACSRASKTSRVGGAATVSSARAQLASRIGRRRMK